MTGRPDAKSLLGTAACIQGAHLPSRHPIMELRLTYDAFTDDAYLTVGAAGPADGLGPTLRLEDDARFAGLISADFRVSGGGWSVWSSSPRARACRLNGWLPPNASTGSISLDGSSSASAAACAGTACRSANGRGPTSAPKRPRHLSERQV